MKRAIIKASFVLSVVAGVSSLSACFHEIEKTEAVIDYPPLSLETNFIALRANSGQAELTEIMAKQMLADALFRFTNIVDIANQSTGLVAEADLNASIKFKSSTNTIPSAITESKFKPAARGLYIVDASNEFCGDTSENEALIWDDKDNDSRASEGDIWFYRVINCQLKINSAYITGLISQTGMYELFLNKQDDEGNSIEPDVFVPYENYLYTLDIQIDPQDGKMAYFKNVAINYSKPEEEITTATIKANSSMGVANTTTDIEGTATTENYMFVFDNANIKNDDDAQTLEITLVATYYDSVMGTYVEMTTPEALVFNYEYKAPGVTREDNNAYDMITLVSGKLQISSGDITASLSVNETDESKVTFIHNNNNDQISTENYDQTTYFNTALEGFDTDRTFSLVNMSR